MLVGVFDSGNGGKLVAEKLSLLLPENHYEVINDLKNAPYGEKSLSNVRKLTEKAIQPILNCDIVVLACNTATAAALSYLRESYPDVLFVGFEPMIKPASQQSVSRKVTLLSTRATAASRRTHDLVEKYGADLKIFKPNTLGWATKIDRLETDDIYLDEVVDTINRGSDIIIIGCTHYIALIPKLRNLFPNINILEPTEAVARTISRIAYSQRL